MAKVISRNPATGDILKEFESTPPDCLEEVFVKSRSAQLLWASLPVRARARHLMQLRETLLNQIDEITDLISAENGKPKFEALVNDLLLPVDLLTFLIRKGPGLLSDQPLPLFLMRHRKSYLNYWPLGVVAVIAAWNFPFSLPFADIVMALLAGNSVVFKPSEVTPQIGQKIQELCDAAGLPAYLVQTVLGDGELGAAIINHRPAKIFFTGSASVGKKVLAAASEHLIPVNLELGGKDPMIVLADADLDHTTSAALWGSFFNAGQACASVERILVHESIAEKFTQQLQTKSATLKQSNGSTAFFDLGPITRPGQSLVYEQQLKQAEMQGAKIIGGGLSQDRKHFNPTFVLGDHLEKLAVYRDETFGPIVTITKFKSVAEAIEKANDSDYGLNASVFTRNISLGEQIARQLEAGTVLINEVAYTHAVAETPWSGVKQSGLGRTHSERGLLEFVHTRHIQKPISKHLQFKSLWWFPYSEFQYLTIRHLFDIYRKSWVDKLKAVALVLWSLTQFLKREKRT